jgi:hypothetical protein
MRWKRTVLILPAPTNEMDQIDAGTKLDRHSGRPDRRRATTSEGGVLVAMKPYDPVELIA